MEIVPARPAATVVLARDSAAGCEVLLVRRNARLDFHGGAWVFPGGRIDASDFAAAGTGEPAVAARYAAVREAWEEAGVRVEPQDLVLFSRWITPVNVPKRFDTWFFVAAATNEAVCTDGGEISEHRWFTPRSALDAHHRGEIELPAPTFVTLTHFLEASDVAHLLAMARERTVECFQPELYFVNGGACTVYHGDVAYGNGDLDRPGPRHRLWMRESGWRYERSEDSP
ncbi:MAG: NUDIX hydrolase [Candidatus Binatia bacterium]|nr:MAG: NUDIX hydrolase [Candidatus Binatia bacterium]